MKGPARTGAAAASAPWGPSSTAVRVWAAGAVVAAVLATVPGTPGQARAESPGPIPPPLITFRPRMLIQSDAVVAHHGPAAPAIEDPTTSAGLYLRRARIGAEATAGIWRSRIIFEASSQPEVPAAGIVAAPRPVGGGPMGLDAVAGAVGGDAPRATEAYVALAPDKAFVLAAGSLRVPLGLSRQVDEGDLRLPERARIVTRATPDYRVGVAAGGDLGLLQYALGTYAAAPRFGSDFAGGGTLYVGRLSAEPLGPVGIAPQLRRRDDPWYGWWRFSVGLSTFLAQLPGSNEWGLGGDGQFQWARLCVTGEVLWTRRTPNDRVGFSIEPGVFVVPDRVELVARVEWFNDDVGPRSVADAWGGSLGATFYSATRNVRLQTAYTARRPTAGEERLSGWAVVRLAFSL